MSFITDIRDIKGRLDHLQEEFQAMRAQVTALVRTLGVEDDSKETPEPAARREKPKD